MRPPVGAGPERGAVGFDHSSQSERGGSRQDQPGSEGAGASVGMGGLTQVVEAEPEGREHPGGFGESELERRQEQEATSD